MAAQIATPTLALMGDEEALLERGRKISEQRAVLGLSKSALAKRAHVDRGTLDRIEEGDHGVRATSVAAVERALADLDEEMSREGGEPQAPGVIRFTVKGVYGAESLVVEGPVENIVELEQAVDRIMRRLRATEDGA